MVKLGGGSGHSMMGKIAGAVRGKAAVASVRFDIYAPFGKSSDEIFPG